MKLLFDEAVWSDWLLAFFFKDAAFVVDGVGTGAGILDSLVEAMEEAKGIWRERALPTRIETGCGFGFCWGSRVGFVGRRSFCLVD